MFEFWLLMLSSFKRVLSHYEQIILMLQVFSQWRYNGIN